MPRPRLNDASKTRAAKKVAEKVGKGTSSSAKSASSLASKVSDAVSNAASKANTSPSTSSAGKTAITVPGLADITPDKVSGMLPSFNSDSYQITDPLNPPESIPQATEAQFEKGQAIYQGAQRALKLTGLAFDTTRERFAAIGKQVKAIGEGVKTATEIEKVKGNYLDYLNQLQTNEQKGIVLDISSHKTVTDRAISINTKSEMDEKLKQSGIAAEKAREETQKKQSELDSFRQQLGQLIKA